MTTSIGLQDVRLVGAGAPFRWLAGGLADIGRAPVAALGYGLVTVLLSFGLCAAIYVTNAPFWTLALSGGFVLVAPMLAMGIYECGRLIEAGERPSLGRILLVAGAMRGDVAYLGVALAAIIAVLVAASAVTGFLALVVIFPWLGFASWRAYRDIVDEDSARPAESSLSTA